MLQLPVQKPLLSLQGNHMLIFKVRLQMVPKRRIRPAKRHCRSHLTTKPPVCGGHCWDNRQETILMVNAGLDAAASEVAAKSWGISCRKAKVGGKRDSPPAAYSSCGDMAAWTTAPLLTCVSIAGKGSDRPSPLEGNIVSCYTRGEGPRRHFGMCFLNY